MGMIRNLLLMNPGEPRSRLFYYAAFRFSVWAYLTAAHGMRCFNGRAIPKEGPVLLLSNHQSFFDLIMIGPAIPHRHFHAMARKTLFDNKLMGAHITMLNAFPVDQQSADIRALRTAIDKLNRGHLVLVYPEGTRTPDGTLQPFLEGVILLMRRAKPTVVTAAVDGGWDVFNQHDKHPRWGRPIGCEIGNVYTAEDLLALGKDDCLNYLAADIERIRLRLRGRLRRISRGKFPPPGPGDEPAVDLSILQQAARGLAPPEKSP